MRPENRISSTPLRRIIGFAILFGGLNIASCYDSIPTAPPVGQMPRLRVRNHVASLPPSSVGLPPDPGSRVFIQTYPFPEQVVVESRITGTVLVTSDPLATRQINGSLDYRGYSQNTTLGTQCAVSAYFEWGISLNPPQNCVAGSGGTWTDTIKVLDSVFAKRGPPVQEPTGQCGAGNACHSYPSSDQVLTLTPLAASLKYSVTPAFRTEAEMTAYYAPYTAFRSAAEPSMLGAFSTPKRFLQRAWHKADASFQQGYMTDINGYCPSTIAICDLPVREAGIFWAKERVNGVEHEDSVAVNCSVGDSLVDFLEARRMYLDAMDSTRPNDANPDNRQEKLFAIVESEPLPGTLHTVWVPVTTSTRCDAQFPVNLLNPGTGYGKIRAWVHTHPTKPNEIITCPNDPPGVTRKALPGLSDTDYVNMKRLNKYYTDSLSNTSWRPVPWYAMDKQEIYRLKPGQRKTESLKKENRFRWDRGRCKWARPTDIQINPFS